MYGKCTWNTFGTNLNIGFLTNLIRNKPLETTKQTIVSIIALATAFIGGDYLDAVEPTAHTHVVTEECTVVRQIEKEM